MKKLLGISALFLALTVPALAQYQSNRLSPDDQRKFDDAYGKWLHDRNHDRDDVPKDERKMQDIMSRYNIPPDVPYDRIASNGGGYGYERGDRDRDDYGRRDDGHRQSRLSPDDQRKFDEAYAKWLRDRNSDRDDVPKDERKMQDIMARYNIPPDVPYDAVASQGRRY